MRSKEAGKYHMTSQEQWIFDQPAYGSDAWFCPKWVQVPENAIGITNAGLHCLISVAKMELIGHYQGNWKEVPGVFFRMYWYSRKPNKALHLIAIPLRHIAAGEFYRLSKNH